MKRLGIRRGWIAAAALVVVALSAARAAAEGPTPLVPPEVVREAAKARVDAIRQGVPSPDLSLLLPPPGDPDPEPPPEWIYRNAVIGPLARAAGGAEGRFQTGLRFLERGSLDEAAEAFADVRTLYPDNARSGDAAFWLAEVRRRQSRLDEAIASLRLVAGTRGAEGAYRLAWFLHSRGRTSEALEVWGKLASDPTSPFRRRAAVALGASLLARGDASAARQVLEAALAGPRPAPGPEEDALYSARLPLAFSLQLLGDLVSAQRALLELLLDRPDHPAAQFGNLALAWTLLEEGNAKEALPRFLWTLGRSSSPILADRARLGSLLAHIDLKEPDRAAEALTALGDRQPWAARGSLSLAWFYLERRDAASALPWAERAAGTEDGFSPLASYLAAESLRLLGRGDEARRRYDAIPAQNSLRPAAIHGKALVALAKEDWEGAFDLLQGLLKEVPDYSEADAARVALASVCQTLGRLDAARRAAEGVPSTSAAFPDALLVRASVASRQARWTDEAALLDRFLSDFSADARCEGALLALARAEFRRGSFQAALAALDALDQRSASASTRDEGRMERGRILAALGQDADARQVAEGELARERVGAAAALGHQTLGLLDARSGECASAVVHYDAALALAPAPDVERDALLGRGRCLYQLGRTDEALRSFRSPALGTSPDALYGQALCLARFGLLYELEKAVVAFGVATKSDPDLRAAELESVLGEARLAEARRLLAEGETAKGLTVLEKAAAAPTRTGVVALQMIAQLREEKGSDAEALEAWDRLAARADRSESCKALRSAARRAENLGDIAGARDRLTRGVASCPSDDVEGRQILLEALGSLELRAGRPSAAIEPLRRAGSAAFSPQGLHALRLLAEAQERAGLQEEALATCLRIGYVYGLESPDAADAVFHAAVLLEAANLPARARSLYEKIAREAHGQRAEDARQALAKLAPREPPPTDLSGPPN